MCLGLLNVTPALSLQHDLQHDMPTFCNTIHDVALVPLYHAHEQEHT